MNDLLQLRSDMQNRYAAVVSGRKSLQVLEKLVRRLTGLLEMNSRKMIRPSTPYWAALSYAVAGAVDETQKILDEAAKISTYPAMTRYMFFFCLVVGVDADVKELHWIFKCIIKVVVDSQANAGGPQDLVQSLRKVNTFRMYSQPNHMIRALSNIQEEPQKAMVA